jgi:hypothetical protein
MNDWPNEDSQTDHNDGEIYAKNLKKKKLTTTMASDKF